MIKHLNKTKYFLSGLLFLPIFYQAQELGPEISPSYFSNALFNTLLVTIIFLLIVIVSLGQALKNISGNDYLLNRFKKKEDDKSNTTKVMSTILIFLFASHQSQAGNATGVQDTWTIGGLDTFTFYSMISIILIEAIILMILYHVIMGFIETEKPIAVKKLKTKTILDKLNASVDIEKEHDILLDHNYDGIRELDNDLPPWWKYGFYLTILIGVLYLINFHVTATGDLQKAEYDKSIIQAKAEVEEYMKTSANKVDETTVKQLTGEDISAGKDLFISVCANCHGKQGQGTVGPNLADAYWLHGGGLSDIFKSIKYGWVDKGMKSWKEDLSPVQIAQLTSFIRTLNGTNPEGGKAAQGDIYVEENIQTKDSTELLKKDNSIKVDSLK